MTPKIVEVEDLKVRFNTNEGTVHAVNGISFDLDQGETLGIVGESGCGKSVSMLAVLKLLSVPPAKISAKKILFKGEDILNASEEKMEGIRGSQVSLIFQDPMTSLNPVLTVGFQIAESLRTHMGMNKKEARERAGELLHIVGFPDAKKLLNDYPHQFSGGMRQRAMIAMSLSCNPSLLIADEPTTALDVTIQAQIVELVKDLRDQLGMALIWITHDLGVIAGLADRLNVMYAGFIIETGPIDDIYENAFHPYTSALLRSIPSVEDQADDKLETIEGFPPELYNPPVGCPFEPRCNFAIDKCRDLYPPLEEREANHLVSCWVDINKKN